MADVVELQRWGWTRAALDAERLAGLDSRERSVTESRHRLIRQAMEALEAYARLDGAEEARRLAELAIERAARKR